ncbi:hypothetical protein PHLCEN_2v4429 [Hermanssonia centrifuga]|uniref:Uncharacterized protein n=1 Tax=Hermanssonia centrifuga TaxID=98765 RepID=A0A2R6PNK5_9APHY|nr:hypothetical protein PHLCEN_2v4429 [Hermanssonia centrifuga]
MDLQLTNATPTCQPRQWTNMEQSFITKIAVLPKGWIHMPPWFWYTVHFSTVLYIDA